MLLATGRELPSDAGWWAELKLDGARGQLRVIDGAPALRTRRGRRCDAEFPEILTAAAGLPDVILDGEIVTLLRESGDPYSLGMMLMNQGYAALQSGALRDADEWLTEGWIAAQDR